MSTPAALRTLWLVRHGQRLDVVRPDWPATAERPHDAPLSSNGIVQARETGARLLQEPPDHIVASPFLRAAQTAHYIADVLDRPVHIAPGLSEAFYARWFPVPPRLLSAAELARHLPRIVPTEVDAPRPSYPETEVAMLDRTRGVMRALLERFTGSLLMVGHGGSIQGLGRALCADTPALHTPFCCLIKWIGADGAWRLEADGRDVSHLSRPDADWHIDGKGPAYEWARAAATDTVPQRTEASTS